MQYAIVIKYLQGRFRNRFWIEIAIIERKSQREIRSN